MSKIIAISIAIILVAAFISPVQAESLWVEKNDPNTSMFTDKTAMKAGDLITIVIVESAVSTQSASTDTKKDSKVTVGPGLGPLLEKIPLFDYSGGDSMKANGSTTRSSKFTATMTAVVTKVNDNGTLEIEGSRLVQTNKEKEEIKLTGMVRQEDVAPDNTVLSSYIANAQITHMGSGPIGSRQKEGLISKIMKLLF